MSSSEFVYNGRSRHLRDAVIGAFLDLVEKELFKNSEDNVIKESDWLLEACKEWQKDWHNMPPGCKDIDLDKYLSNEKRVKQFKEILDRVISIEPEDTVRDELERVRELIS